MITIIVHTDRCGNTGGPKCRAKGSREDTKIRQFMYRDTANVEHVFTARYELDL